MENTTPVPNHEGNSIQNTSATPPKKSRMPYVILRVEGLVMMISTLIMVIYLQTHWLLIIGGFFCFDIALLGYKVNPRVGAIMYDLSHTESFPIVLLLIGVIISNSLIIAITLLWLGHIGYDRMQGFGLKYPNDFNESHFQHLL